MIDREESDKLVGKFIRSKSKLYDKVSIMEFDFQEIAVSQTTYTDNINGNIIHARYHEEQEISLASQTPEKFDDELLPPEAQAPLMVPVDFTEEWQETRSNNRKKSSSVFENETDVLAEINRKFSDILGDNVTTEENGETQKSDDGTREDTVKSPLEASENIDKVDKGDARELSDLPSSSQTPHVSNPDLTKQQQDTIASQEASMDFLSKKINDFNVEEEQKVENTSENNPEYTNATQGEQSFVPLDTAPTQGLKEVDKDSVDTYLSQKELEEIRNQAYQDAVAEIDLKKIQQEAKSKGYEEGFKQGEAKASLSVKAETESALGKVGDLVDEFEKLKFNILENVQENFHEITQAVCEAVLDHSITVEPKKFAKIIQNAINQTVESDNFKIRVNPKKMEQFQSVDLGNLDGKFIADSDLKEDEFKVDSDLTSVSSSIKEIILELLDKADLDLFESDQETDKVS
jgi:flagellar assembly protein FliH